MWRHAEASKQRALPAKTSGTPWPASGSRHSWLGQGLCARHRRCSALYARAISWSQPMFQHFWAVQLGVMHDIVTDTMVRHHPGLASIAMSLGAIASRIGYTACVRAVCSCADVCKQRALLKQWLALAACFQLLTPAQCNCAAGRQRYKLCCTGTRGTRGARCRDDEQQHFQQLRC